MLSHRQKSGRAEALRKEIGVGQTCEKRDEQGPRGTEVALRAEVVKWAVGRSKDICLPFWMFFLTWAVSSRRNDRNNLLE